MAFITAVIAPGEFTVEAVQPVALDDYPKVKETFKKLVYLAKKTKYDGQLKRPTWDAEGSNPMESAKKCKQLGRNPTDASLPEEGTDGA